MEQRVLEHIRVRAKEPFRFFTRLNLTELTGLKARNLPELLDLLEVVPSACVYYHTHQFFQEHDYLTVGPSNDFAYWVGEILREEALGERLAAINTVQFSTIQSLREAICEVICNYVDANPSAKLRFSGEGDEFHFMKSMSYILPTPYMAWDLREFREHLQHVTHDSIYFHMIESRLRLGKPENDFANWIGVMLGNVRIAERISQIDPYSNTLEGVRTTVLNIIEREEH
jgi:hypothetical protein